MLAFLLVVVSICWWQGCGSRKTVKTHISITPAKVEALHEGMSYGETVRIIGGTGEEVSGQPRRHYKEYIWRNKDGTWVGAGFENDKLIMKEASWLKTQRQ
jgi:hypothetical protein